MTGVAGDKLAELRGLIRQIGIAGTARRAAILHLDRLPAALPRKQRQAFGEAASSLATADRSRQFLLPRGALAIVWRNHGEDELRPVLGTLTALLDGLPRAGAPAPGALLTVYDLPGQSAFLLDALDETHPGPLPGQEAIGLPALTRLETAIAQADLTPVLRRAPVCELGADGIWRPAWDRLHLRMTELLASLWPGPALSTAGSPGAWLERCAAHRLLAHMTGARALEEGGPFCIALSPETILSAHFSAFDQALPARLRGALVLAVRAADILRDGAAFARARAVARAGRFRLLLDDGEAAFLDPDPLDLDFVQRPFTGREEDLPPSRDRLVLSGIDSAEQRDWAVAQGCRRITGLAAA